MRVVFAERARQDISDIYDSSAQHNRAAAQCVEDAIRADCDRLGAFPYASAATDEMMAGVAEFSNLKSLGLSGSPITDRGLEPLLKLANLTNLGLDRTQITDQGFESLLSLPKLQSVHAADTAVTEACRQRVQKILESRRPPGFGMGMRPQ